MRPVLAAVVLGAAACSRPPPLPPYEPPDDQFVLFGSGSGESVSPDGYFALGYVVALAQERPSYEILVVGHADVGGSAEINRDLSLRRARSVKKILLSHGVAAARVILATPRSVDKVTAPALARRADLYLYDPTREQVLKRVGDEVELSKE